MLSTSPALVGYQLVVVAKAPVPGRVKTRLCPPLDSTQAATLAEASLVDTLTAAVKSTAVRTTLVLDGAPGSWTPSDVTVIPQSSGGLDNRLAAAFRDTWSDCGLPMLLIGMDTPQVTSELLDSCGRRLLAGGAEAVLGLARDGGWWALGLSRPDDGLLIGVEMSTPSTGTEQLSRLRGSGFDVGRLPTLVDVDLINDAYDVAGVAPNTAFAAVLRRITAAA